MKNPSVYAPMRLNGGSPSHSSNVIGSKNVKNTPVAAPAQMNDGHSTALIR